MTLSRKSILREFRDFVLLSILGVVMTWVGLTCRNCFDTTREFWIIASFTSLIWIFLWKGNEYLADYISTFISWIDFPLRRFVIGILTTIAYTFLALYGIGFLYSVIFGLHATSQAMYSVIITVIISLFMHGRAFLVNWRQTAIDAEKLKRENVEARYESLRSQVNPHFLFNSLNALTNLVYEDQDKAVKFIKQLSEVYRYVLDTRSKELVPLQEELDFLRSYIYLQQIRFGNKLKIDLQLHPDGMAIAPLALQMLMENAIKHNVVSEDDPLTIRVYKDEQHIVVENNLQKKTIAVEPSAGVGLENICKRYEFLTDREVEILQDESTFKVRLPIIFQNNV